MHQDFTKFDSCRFKVQYMDELNHFVLYNVHWKLLIEFLQSPRI
jgi:hypothetical protein